MFWFINPIPFILYSNKLILIIWWYNQHFIWGESAFVYKLIAVFPNTSAIKWINRIVGDLNDQRSSEYLQPTGWTLINQPGGRVQLGNV